MTEFKNGDHVRISFDGVWKDGAVKVKPYAFGREFQGVGTVERIEPPVEVFGPGDVVRDPYTNQVFLLVPDGYVQVAPTVGQANPLDWGDGEPPETFTSEHYERTTVTL